MTTTTNIKMQTLYNRFLSLTVSNICFSVDIILSFSQPVLLLLLSSHDSESESCYKKKIEREREREREKERESVCVREFCRKERERKMSELLTMYLSYLSLLAMHLPYFSRIVINHYTMFHFPFYYNALHQKHGYLHIEPRDIL